MAEESKGGKVKVIDRRWFTTEGDLREPPSPSETAEPRPAAQAAPPTPPPPAREEPEPDPKAERPADVRLPSDIGFLDLVDFLAQQAMAFLSGQVPGHGRDPATARFFVDLLGVVQDKTAGQLNAQESRYLEDILYQLRSLYVAATR